MIKYNMDLLIQITVFAEGRDYARLDEKLFRDPNRELPSHHQPIYHTQKARCRITRTRNGYKLRILDKYEFKDNPSCIGFDDIYMCFEYGQNVCYIRWNKFEKRRETRKRYKTGIEVKRYYDFEVVSDPNKSFYPPRCYYYYRFDHMVNFLKGAMFSQKLYHDRISRAWRRCVDDPRYAICKRRLVEEFQELDRDVPLDKTRFEVDKGTRKRDYSEAEMQIGRRTIMRFFN